MIPSNRIEKILIKRGYQIISNDIPGWFTWRPNILAKKNNGLVAYTVRESNNIPEVLLQRITNTRRRIKKIIVFCRTPNASVIKLIKVYQVGACLFRNNRLTEIVKILPAKGNIISKKTFKKMTKTDIFISSHQKTEERKTAKNTTDNLRESYGFPLFPVCIENDSRYGIDKTRQCMKDNMDKSDWFLGIIAEQYRPDVDWEIKYAFRIYNHQDIIIFVKNIKTQDRRREKLIKWIKKQKTVKYLEYNDNIDIEHKINSALMIRISRLCKTQKIPIFEN